MDYKNIIFEVTDNIGLITLNRPDDANSINKPMVEELADIAMNCYRDDSIRSVVLTGSGKMFCGGGDLKAFVEQGDAVSNYVDQTATVLHQSISRFARMDSPLVIAVNGVAAGGGFSLALAGDYIIAADTAKFISAYTASGLSPDGSSTFYLAKHIGLLRAKELILTNRLLSAEEACNWGMVTKVVPSDNLLDEAMAMANKFSKGPTKAYGISKNLLNSTYSETLEAQLDSESRGIASSMGNEDGRHGIDSFYNKKKPTFKGK
jgi:2-(1,2-epoxy-1,2-dihydrophenyl)acetyl-CoA isomerase|tara:strand:- start:1331 stop:2119 length:789 start_codon:yes stop_codon:yes gene_type:complete